MREPPTFNLWSEPWLTVEWQISAKRPLPTLSTLSLQEALSQAHDIHALYEPSPLVVAAVHRLLVAILQDIYQPQHPPDLVAIWQNGRFHLDKLAEFGNRYANRFDLFSEDAPFLQTSDLGLQPAKEDKAKPVAYLLQEQSAGTAVTHYNHAYDDTQTFCASCAAKGILLTPPFASSGGAGIKPSINGVPPIYVFPGGDTLFDSLTASLTTPAFQPIPSQSVQDKAWWQRPLPITIGKSNELRRVGYLHSLLFPARRVRLHPQKLTQPCTCCGAQTAWGVSTMVYEMGESRPKTASFWRDPFAAYRIPKNAQENPLPIRPVTNRVLWREFDGLFLADKPDENSGLKGTRPAILDQLEEVWRDNQSVLPFKNIPLRAIGLLTDMKMKIFEWDETGFTVPPRLLTDADAAHTIKISIDFAVRSEGTLKSTFNQYFGGGGKSERYAALKKQMSQQYWQALGEAFQQYILQFTLDANSELLFHQWLDTVLKTGRQVFQETVLSLPATGDVAVPNVKRYSNLNRSDIKMIRLREDAMDDCAKFLYGYRKKNYPKPQEVS